MPLDFASRRITFPSASGGQQTESRTFDFPSRIRRAETFINGFNIGFDNDEHPILRTEVNTRVDNIEDDNVTVVATFSIRDNSGNFDDRYSGFIDVAVVVDRV